MNITSFENELDFILNNDFRHRIFAWRLVDKDKPEIYELANKLKKLDNIPNKTDIFFNYVTNQNINNCVIFNGIFTNCNISNTTINMGVYLNCNFINCDWKHGYWHNSNKINNKYSETYPNIHKGLLKLTKKRLNFINN